MSFFQETETYTVTIKDGEEEAEITLRPLTAGDTAFIQDTLALSPEGEVGIKIGTVRMMTIRRAVVKWSLGKPVNEHTIAALKSSVADQIFDAIQSDGTEDSTDDDAAPLEDAKSSKTK